MSYNVGVAEPNKTISLRIPLRLYEDMLDDLNRIASEIERERGGGHNSKNAALLKLIEGGLAVERAEPHPKTGTEPPGQEQAAKRKRK